MSSAESVQQRRLLAIAISPKILILDRFTQSSRVTVMPGRRPKVSADDEFEAAPYATRKLAQNLGVEVMRIGFISDCGNNVAHINSDRI